MMPLEPTKRPRLVWANRKPGRHMTYKETPKGKQRRLERRGVREMWK